MFQRVCDKYNIKFDLTNTDMSKLLILEKLRKYIGLEINDLYNVLSLIDSKNYKNKVKIPDKSKFLNNELLYSFLEIGELA